MDTRIPPLLQATSGALGSVAGKAIVFPLDSAVTRIQTTSGKSNADKVSLLNTLYRLTRKRGFKSLYRGFNAETVSTLLSSFIYFYLYSYFHKIALKRKSVPVLASPAGIGSTGSKPPLIKLGPIEELIIGLGAGVISKGFVLPISAVCIRQQLDDSPHQDDSGVLQALRDIKDKEGLSSLWAALPPSIPLALLPSLTLYIHTVLLRILVPLKHRAHPPGLITFGIGALSNALATLPLYPMVLIKVLSQAGKQKNGQIDTLKRILKERGVAGLYQGIQGQLVKGVVQQGVMMLLKQRIEEAIILGYRSFA